MAKKHPSSAHAAEPAFYKAEERPSQAAHSRELNHSSRLAQSSQSSQEILLSRRHFLYGALGVGALALAAHTSPLTSVRAFATTSPDETISVLDVPEDAVSSLEGDAASVDSFLTLAGSFELPYGTLIWTNNDSVAACLFPTEKSNPLTQAGILSLPHGSYKVLLENAIGQDKGFEIYDIRASEEGIIWTEANILSGIWRVYGARLQGNTRGEAHQLDEGDDNWETPSIAAVGSYAFWQVLPTQTGSYKTSNSVLKRADFEGQNSTVLCTSQGRMSTPLYPLKDSLVITPRTATTAVHYQLTLIDAASGETKDTLVLPQGMKPLEAGYGNTGFTFSFDSIYNYGGGIANLGTYTPLSSHDAYGYTNLSWFHFNKTPSAAPAWCNNLFIVKSKRVCSINLANKTYGAIEVESGSDSYGDYLASTGVNETFVTFANINSKPLGGEARKYCLVRVWKAL